VDIKKCKEQQFLYESDKFWREFIVKAAGAKISEPQLWDFKETLNIWHAKDEPARRKAKVTLAEDVASFANVSGGVLVVGITDSREIVGVGDGKDLENRLKTTKEVITGYVEYEKDLTSLRQVVMTDNHDKICLVIVISQARGAVGVNDGQGRYSYPVRVETGINLVSRDEVPVSKLHLKSDNRDFLPRLNQFIREN
jgi:hypothetical protein